MSIHEGDTVKIIAYDTIAGRLDCPYAVVDNISGVVFMITGVKLEGYPGTHTQFVFRTALEEVPQL